jgi:hypothetical protein
MTVSRQSDDAIFFLPRSKSDDAIFFLPRSKSKPRSKSNRFDAQGNCGKIKSRQRGYLAHSNPQKKSENLGMQGWVGCLIWLVFSATAAGEKDMWQNSSEKLKHWRHVKKLAEYDRPAIATPQASALGNSQEHQKDIVPVPTHLTHADSDADTAGQHGIDHPAIVIDLPVIECECKYSYGSDATNLAGREQDGDASSMESTACNAERRVYLIFVVRGLVPGFVYEVQFECEWSGQGDYHWKTVLTPSTRSYTVKLSLERSQKTHALNSHTSMWDTYIPQKDAFVVEVTVRDLHPGLTSEEALIGTKRLNSVVNTAQLRCTDLEFGERTNMPACLSALSGGEDEWKFNFSAAVEDVRAVDAPSVNNSKTGSLESHTNRQSFF